MKNKIALLKKAGITVIMITVFMALFVSATADTYVTENDPLVSLSYINNVLTPSLKSYVDGKVSNISADELASAIVNSDDFKNYVSDLVEEKIREAGLNPSSHSSASSEFENLELAAGQKITAIGKVELILQSGAANAFCQPSSGAVKDLSAGKTLANGESLTVGNYVEISYADGSGVAAVRGGTSLLIRGEYTVVK